MHISNKKSDHKNITASVRITDEDDLKAVLEEVLTPDDCEAIVNYGQSDSGYFDTDAFWDSSNFWVVYENVPAEDMVDGFYSGTNLDADEDHANPNHNYFRYDRYGSYVESTDYPGDIYKSEILDDIINYIIDNVDSIYLNDNIELSEDVVDAIELYQEHLDDEDSEEEE